MSGEGARTFKYTSAVRFTWRDGTLTSLRIDGAPDQIGGSPGGGAGRFLIKQSADQIVLSEHAQDDGTSQATLLWAEGELARLAIAGPFPERGEHAPVQARQVFKVELSGARAVLRADPTLRAVAADAVTAALGWDAGVLKSVRLAVDDAQADQVSQASRVYRVGRDKTGVALRLDVHAVPATVEYAPSGAPFRVELPDPDPDSPGGPFGGEEPPTFTLERKGGRFILTAATKGAKAPRPAAAAPAEQDLLHAIDRTARSIEKQVRTIDQRTVALTTKLLERHVIDAAHGVVASALQQNFTPRRLDAALPLVLIGQVQRSGGSLLSQLFDGHPQVLAFPHELKWGGRSASKYRWPPIDPAVQGPLRIARHLVAANLEDIKKFNLFGYQKEPSGEFDQRLPFRWSQWAYVEAFLEGWEQSPPTTRRQCLDLFMSAYFAAFPDWRDREAPKTLITAFTPRVNFIRSFPENAAFFEDYPEGTMICLCRHPSDWYASASRHSEGYVSLEESMTFWRESAEGALELKARHPGRVVLITFEELINDTRGVMQRLAGRLGLDWRESLVVPSFNAMPVSSNSSFGSAGGIDGSAIGRRQTLPPVERDEIEADGLALYERFAAETF